MGNGSIWRKEERKERRNEARTEGRKEIGKEVTKTEDKEHGRIKEGRKVNCMTDMETKKVDMIGEKISTATELIHL